MFVLVIYFSVKSDIEENNNNLHIMALSRMKATLRFLLTQTQCFTEGAVVTGVFLWRAESHVSNLLAIEQLGAVATV